MGVRLSRTGAFERCHLRAKDRFFVYYVRPLLRCCAKTLELPHVDVHFPAIFLHFHVP